MSEPGRNDPCHCGSGKKYKKCHGDATGAPNGIELWKRTIEMDQRLMTQVTKLGISRYGEKGFDPFFLEPEDEHRHGEECDHDNDEVLFADVSFPLALFTDEKFGAPIAQQFLDTKSAFIAADERAWLQAQLKTQFSLWQLTAMGVGGEITLKDRLTDREVTVIDGEVHDDGKKNDLMLARVIDHEARSVMTSIHPEIVEADDADDAVTHVKEALAAAPKTDTYGTQLALVDAWNDVVYGDDEEDEEEVEDEATSV